MRKDIAFLSAAFDDQRYINMLKRQIESIRTVYRDAELLYWVNEYPGESKPHLESLYGFKVHAVMQALERGYEKIIWMDSACILLTEVDPWWKICEDKGVLAVRDDNALSGTISTKAMEYYGNPDITGMHLVGGSLYVFDFAMPMCQKIFDHWKQAEADGIFGSQKEAASEQINGHRHDESCMAMALYQNRSAPVSNARAGYNTSVDPIILKRHFK